MARTADVQKTHASALEKRTSQDDGKNLIEDATNLQIVDDSLSTQNFQSKQLFSDTTNMVVNYPQNRQHKSKQFSMDTYVREDSRNLDSDYRPQSSISKKFASQYFYGASAIKTKSYTGSQTGNNRGSQAYVPKPKRLESQENNMDRVGLSSFAVKNRIKGL